MSGPYVYNPNPTYVPSGYMNYPSSPQHSPFIPSPTLYPASPYSNPVPLGGSPHVPALSLAPPGSPNAVPWPLSDDVSYVPVRQRRPSFHGELIPPVSPFNDAYRLDADPYFRERRRSFGGGGGYFSPGGWNTGAAPTSPSGFMLHPWLNADVWRGDFGLDLTARDFRPLQIYSVGQSRPCPLEYLNQAATHPPITRLRIVSELTPDWPIDIPHRTHMIGGTSALEPWTPGFGIDTTGTRVPITLGDVLIAIHRNLHTRITHADFNRLSLTQEKAVTRAYRLRCRAAGSFEGVELSEGVKRVDYFLDRKWFRGLILDWEAGLFRLAVA